MSSTYGENLKLSIFGQSHGNAVGMVLDGIPAGLAVDFDKLQAFLNRRAPGRNEWSSPRTEEDVPEFLGGIYEGFTCGAPIAAVIRNHNVRSADYSDLKNLPRPGHADFTADVKYGGFQDPRGGGHFSGRLTAPLCIAGGLCKQWLEELGIRIGAHILAVGEVGDRYFDPMDPELEAVHAGFPTLDPDAGSAMRDLIADAKAAGDSLGGIIECAVTGLPAGLGEPMFGGVESRIAQIVYAIPAVKGVEFGMGFDCACIPGSAANDGFALADDRIITTTNNCGGILGGITTGMPVIFTAAFKATPSIAAPQQTVNLKTGEQETLTIRGRHDPCILPRAVPVLEAAAAIAIYDLVLGNTQAGRRK